MLIHGLLNFPWWGDLLTLLVFCHITLIATTVYLHRYQAHKSLELHPIISHFLRFWLWLSTSTITKEWVAVHRKHHAKCDTAEDPHSPVVLGIKTVFWKGAELYRKAAMNAETLERYGRGTPNDWVERNIYTRLSWLGIAAMAVIDIMLFGLSGIWMWGIQMLNIPVLAAGVINGIGHYWGYRNFDIPEAACNITPIAVFICGEELHNNHHTYPNSAKLSVKWYEFDLGWFYINSLRKLRLAKVFSIAPKLKSIPGRSMVDTETVAAVIGNRFQILARYTKDVLLPILKQERLRAGNTGKALFYKAKALLTRETNLIDERNKKRLSQMLTKHQMLSQAYQFRQRLQEIWGKTSSSQKELLEALQEWCRQAEATGIESLKNFSTRLKSYVLCSIS